MCHGMSTSSAMRCREYAFSLWVTDQESDDREERTGSGIDHLKPRASAEPSAAPCVRLRGCGLLRVCGLCISAHRSRRDVHTPLKP